MLVEAAKKLFKPLRTCLPRLVRLQPKQVLPLELGDAGLPCAAGPPAWRDASEQGGL